MVFQMLQYQANLTVAEPPTGNQLRFNNADQTLVTKLWVSYSTVDGFDVRNLLPLISVDDEIAVQDFDDGTRFVRYHVAGPPIDKGSYFEIPVSFLSIKSPVLAQKVIFAMLATDAGDLPRGGDPSEVLTKTGAADYEVEWLVPAEGPTPPEPEPGPDPEPTPVGCESWDAIYPCDVSMESPDCLADAVAAATTLVSALSGRQFGLCTVTLRPCRSECTSWGLGWEVWSGAGFWSPSTAWYFLMSDCAACGYKCSCSNVSRAELPYPVHDVVRVTLDGSPMVTGAYRVDDSRVLVRTDGGAWPLCNDLTKDDTEVGTWSVTARYGKEPPVAGRLAVGEVACEVLKSFRGEECGLPTSVTQLVRQGVTVSIPDTGELFSKGRTGLYLTDLFIQSVNPRHLKRRARAFSVDYPTPTRAGT